MYFLPDSFLDELLAEDIPYGDLTMRLLGADHRAGRVECFLKADGVVAGAEIAERLFQKVGLATHRTVRDGKVRAAGEVFLTAEGEAGRIHAVYKTAQNVMEYCSGIAQRAHAMVTAAQAVSPRCQVVTTRKHFPGTKCLSLYAAQAGGALVHRTGLSESVLVFDQHRVFCDDFLATLSEMAARDPERKIAVEAGTIDEALAFAEHGAHIVQCEKMPPDVFAELVRAVRTHYPDVLISAAGGVKAENAAAYALAGADFLVTTWPYFGRPADVKMRISAA